jgi:hypothetical protein
VVVVPAPLPEAPQPLEVAAEGAAEGTIPFARGQVWTGVYECPQGETELRLHIDAVDAKVVHARFAFVHAPSGTRGEFELRGTYDPSGRRLELDPGRWIDRPDDWITVGMAGRVSPDSRRYSGSITNPACGAFLVKLDR